jgi:hypothetical protein
VAEEEWLLLRPSPVPSLLEKHFPIRTKKEWPRACGARIMAASAPEGRRRRATRRPYSPGGSTVGFFDTIKGWMNIGGVKVKIEGLNPSVKKSESQLSARVVLTTKSDKQILGMTYKFMLRRTKGSGDSKEVKESTVGSSSSTETFDLKAGETKTIDFAIPYSMEKTLADMGGVLGGLGKLAAFAGDKLEYYVSATAKVKGAAFDPSDTIWVTVVS